MSKESVTKPGKGLSEFITEHAPTPEIEHLQTELRIAQRKLAKARKELGGSRLLAQEVADSIVAAKPLKIRYKKQPGKGDPITCVMHLTDLHDGAVIEADETSGRNEFNPDILGQRLQTYVDKVLDHVGTNRAGYKIPNLHILLTGDYIEGDIHFETAVTNAYPPPVQAVEIGYKIAAVVEGCAPHFENVQVDMITTDNHSRLTRKNQYAQGGKNNYGYVAASIVKERLRNLKNVEFRMHPSQTMLVDVAGTRYLCLHGHQIRGHAGIPYYGFDRRLMMEAIAVLQVPDQHFRKMLTGHYHVACDTMWWGIGGCASGTNAFDRGNGRHAQAHQTSWFVHPRHGEFGWSRFWME